MDTRSGAGSVTTIEDRRSPADLEALREYARHNCRSDRPLDVEPDDLVQERREGAAAGRRDANHPVPANRVNRD
jgi:hypothetical protein